MEALQLQLIIGLGVVLALVIGVVFWSVPLAEKFRGSVISGVLRVGKRSYEYQLGDQILRYGGATTFSGIQMTTAKAATAYIFGRACQRQTDKTERVCL